MAGTTERRHARMAVARRLRVAILDGRGSHGMLSELGRAVLGDDATWTRESAELLRSKLVWLLDDGPEGSDGDELAEMWADGMSVKAMAYRTGRTDGSLYTEIRSDRTRFPQRRKRSSQEMRDKAMALVAEGGLSVDEVAEFAGVSSETIRRWIREARRKA